MPPNPRTLWRSNWPTLPTLLAGFVFGLITSGIFFQWGEMSTNQRHFELLEEIWILTAFESTSDQNTARRILDSNFEKGMKLLEEWIERNPSSGKDCPKIVDAFKRRHSSTIKISFGTAPLIVSWHDDPDEVPTCKREDGARSAMYLGK